MNNQNQKPYKPKENYNNNMLPGDSKESPDESFSKNKNKPQDTVVFIDEAFLSKLSKYFGNEKYVRFDRQLFSFNLSKKEKLNCKDIFFYIAPPYQGPFPTREEEERKKGFDEFIFKLKEKNIIVRMGRCQRLKINDKFEYNQKAVDVLLAMDLTNVPLKYPGVKKIIIISSDSDFVPVINNLQEQGIKIILYTYYEKMRDSNFSRSNDLIKSVYKYVQLTKEDLENAKFKT
jgi:uncharacterized LabA/DUF88 family protein